MAAREDSIQCTTPEYDAIKQCFDELVQLIRHHLEISDTLLSKSLIPTSYTDDITVSGISDSDKARIMLYAVMDKIEFDYTGTTFRTFVDILETEGYFNIVSQKLNTLVEKNRPSSENSDEESFLSAVEDLSIDQSEPQFPDLDVKNLSDLERCDLERKLTSDTRKMEQCFYTFSDTIQKSLDANFIALDDVKGVVLGESAVENQDKKEIRHARSVIEVFNILRAGNYITFFNYYIVENLVKRFGSDKDHMHKQLDTYLQELNKFCERSVFQVPRSVFDCKAPRNGKILALKCTQDVISLNKVREIMCDLVDYFIGVKLADFQLCTIKEGCVELHFLVSAAAAERVFPVISSQPFIQLGKIRFTVVNPQESSSAESQLSALTSYEPPLNVREKPRNAEHFRKQYEPKFIIGSNDKSPKPTQVTDYCSLVYHANMDGEKNKVHGKWLLFRTYAELDSMWEKILHEARTGSLKDCVLHVRSSTLFFNPRRAGPGPRISGVIAVATTEDCKEKAGLALVNIVKHDINYKTLKEKPQYAWMGDTQFCETFYWNEGQPSCDMTSQCNGPVCAIEDRWHLNVVRSPGYDGIPCGHWKIGMKRHSNYISTALWHDLKKVIEQDQLGPVEMVAPKRDANREKPQDDNSILNEFILSTVCHNKKIVGERIAKIISKYKEPNVFINYEKKKVCNPGCQLALEWDGRYKHSIAWDQRSESFTIRLDLVATDKS